MGATVKSPSEMYGRVRNQIRSVAETLTDFSEGSNLDAVCGAIVFAGNELAKYVIDEFMTKFFGTAEGQDLEDLAIDQFGEDFARPEAKKSQGIVTFARPTNTFGNLPIPAGTIVKTVPDGGGNVQSFVTVTDVLLTGLSIQASVQASVAGVAGNVEPATVVVIESSLADSSVTVTNADDMTGGAEEESDPVYRETIKRLILTLAKSTIPAIEAAAKGIPGVVQAKIVERLQTVIEWDIGNAAPIGDPFFIPRVVLYISDANGTASDALLNQVRALLQDEYRGCGVYIEVLASEPVEIDWTVALTLDSGGPNYASLQTNPDPILNTMEQYLGLFANGQAFVRSTADAAIMAIWGPSGTGDLTQFQTIYPVGDVSVDANERIVPGELELT